VQSLDIGGSYWIVRLDKDYKYSVVSSKDYSHLWILYREPLMPDSLYNAIYNDLKNDGFDVDKLKRTPQ
jgi:apolipoprotein D and lipocalin family protein